MGNSNSMGEDFDFWPTDKFYSFHKTSEQVRGCNCRMGLHGAVQHGRVVVLLLAGASTRLCVAAGPAAGRVRRPSVLVCTCRAGAGRACLGWRQLRHWQLLNRPLADPAQICGMRGGVGVVSGAAGELLGKRGASEGRLGYSGPLLGAQGCGPASNEQGLKLSCPCPGPAMPSLAVCRRGGPGRASGGAWLQGPRRHARDDRRDGCCDGARRAGCDPARRVLGHG
jgi:hypothetical protein